MPTPLTVEFIGSRVDAIEAITNVAAEKIAGGGAAPAAQIASLVQQGTAAVGTTYPTASRFVTLDYDIVGAGGTALDFSSGGTDEGQMLWVWGNGLLPLTSTGTNTNGAIGGLGIVLSDNATTSNSWALWTFYGAENYPGGFVKMVLDPRLRPSASGGTFAATSLSSIRRVGIFFVSDNAAKGGADAAILDAIDLGSGLRIYGSGTPDAGFKDLIDADEGTLNNRYGVVKSLDSTSDIIQIQGVLEIGSGNNAQTVFDDINRIVAFNNPQYIDTSVTPQAFINSLPDTFQQVKLVGNSTSGTIIRMGEKVGVGDNARGRNGCAILGNTDYRQSFLFNDNALVDNCLLYGTTIRNFTSQMTWLNTPTGHEFIGSTVDGCREFTADSGVIIRNSTFQNSYQFDPAFRWNSGTNIKNSNFIANEYGIHHPFTGTFIYDNLQFSDNTTDILFTYNPSGTLIIQATNGANPGGGTPGLSGDINSQIIIENTVLLTLTDIVPGSEVRIYESNPTGVFPVELAGTESEDDGTFEYAYNYTGLDFDADIVIVNTGYVYFRQNNNTLTNTPNTIKINQVFDRNYENP